MSKEPIDARALRKKIEGLYKDSDLTQDDKKIIRDAETGERTKLLHSDPEFKKNWHEKNIDRYNDPTYVKKVSKSIATTYSTPEMREVQRKKFLGKTHDAETKQKLINANIGKQRKGQSWIAGMVEKKKGNGHHNKPFLTPSGAFPSKKQAIDWATSQGVRNAGGKFGAWLKDPASGFRYIPLEEFESLKDNSLITGLEWMLNISSSPRYKNEKPN